MIQNVNNGRIIENIIDYRRHMDVDIRDIVIDE